MNDYAKHVIAKYSQKGILVDTNILLLYIVGKTNKRRVPIFKRTDRFAPEDFDTLSKILTKFQKVITTPSILTEVSNLANQLNEPERAQCFTFFASEIQNIEENYCDSKLASQEPKFLTFGLTDCGIAQISQDKYLVLTDDFPLSNYLTNKGIDTLNFNHIRHLGWSS